MIKNKHKFKDKLQKHIKEQHRLQKINKVKLFKNRIVNFLRS